MSAANEVREDRRYTREHEWAKATDGEIVVGITAFAVEQLGDITLVDITAGPGARVEAGQAFGTIESVKTLSDLFAPVAGTVTRVNQELVDHPERVNEAPWDAAWMIAIAPDRDPAEQDGLLDPAAYAKLLEESAD